MDPEHYRTSTKRGLQIISATTNCSPGFCHICSWPSGNFKLSLALSENVNITSPILMILI